MATYRVWLTVKDSYGNTKEVDGGTINVDLATLTPDELAQIEDALPLEEYLKKDELKGDLAKDEIRSELNSYYATDEELATAIKDKTLQYGDFELIEEGGK